LTAWIGLLPPVETIDAAFYHMVVGYLAWQYATAIEAFQIGIAQIIVDPLNAITDKGLDLYCKTRKRGMTDIDQPSHRPQDRASVAAAHGKIALPIEIHHIHIAGNPHPAIGFSHRDHAIIIQFLIALLPFPGKLGEDWRISKTEDVGMIEHVECMRLIQIDHVAGRAEPCIVDLGRFAQHDVHPLHTAIYARINHSMQYADGHIDFTMPRQGYSMFFSTSPYVAASYWYDRR
jgi:hypothetical protein